MITPPNLNPGDYIGLVSPAKKIEASIIKNAMSIIEQLGYSVKTGKYFLAGNRYLAGTDDERAADFQAMLDDPEIKMMLCSRGGYGSARIIDRLDFSGFLKCPKWVAGYSDITVFHAHLFNLGFESLHCTMPLDFPENGQSSGAINELFKIASGGTQNYRIEPKIYNRPGIAKGELAGGNLSILCSLLGSASDVDASGKILFIEEVGEDLYRIDRMMITLKRAGKLKHLAGLIIGGMPVEKIANAFDFTVEEIILNAVSEYDFPVAFGFPAGHFPDNYPLVIGRKMRMEVGEEVVVREV